LATICIAISDASDGFFEYADELGNVGSTNLHVPGAEYIKKPTEPHDGFFDVKSLFMSDNLRWCMVNFFDMGKEIKSALTRKRRTTG
jgi:hypothetical protein